MSVPTTTMAAVGAFKTQLVSMNLAVLNAFVQKGLMDTEKDHKDAQVYHLNIESITHINFLFFKNIVLTTVVTH